MLLNVQSVFFHNWVFEWEARGDTKIVVDIISNVLPCCATERQSLLFHFLTTWSGCKVGATQRHVLMSECCINYLEQQNVKCSCSCIAPTDPGRKVRRYIATLKLIGVLASFFETTCAMRFVLIWTKKVKIENLALVGVLHPASDIYIYIYIYICIYICIYIL